jgi:hypothetical protein
MRDSEEREVVTCVHAEKTRTDFERIERAWPAFEGVSGGASGSDTAARGVMDSSHVAGKAGRVISHGAHSTVGLREPEEESGEVDQEKKLTQEKGLNAEKN